MGLYSPIGWSRKNTLVDLLMVKVIERNAAT